MLEVLMQAAVENVPMFAFPFGQWKNVCILVVILIVLGAMHSPGIGRGLRAAPLFLTW
jgi:hypothetical protein